MNETAKECIRKLEAIGKFNKFIVDKKRTLIGYLDGLWSLNITLAGKKDILIPLIAFEVIVSEGQKEIKGSALNLINSKAPLCIFVLLPEEIKKHKRGGHSENEWLEKNQYQLMLGNPLF